MNADTPEQRSLAGRLIRFCLTNKLAVGVLTVAIGLGGVIVAPFDWDTGPIPRFPVATDAIPDIGENQQIVFTEWMGRSPQDIDQQITYPLTAALRGVPGTRTVRSYSFFGFSTIYVIFHENVDFHWSRSRVLEKLASLPAGTLPEGVKPALGPDATPLGQIFWYTLEGRDPQGRPAGGWDLEEFRSLQDWYVRYWLLSAEGVAEVASVGGYVREYQVDVDPDAMRAYGVTLMHVAEAVKASNLDVGAGSIEQNRVEYYVRGVGFLRDPGDIADSVVKAAEGVPVLVRHVANVSLGPQPRMGALDKGGAQAVGGVVVARFGANPLETIKNVKRRIGETRDSLPAKVVIDYSAVSPGEVASFARRHGFEPFQHRQGDRNGQEHGTLDQKAWLDHLRAMAPEGRPAWATISQVTVVPLYDRTGLIYETLGTLNDAIAQEILVTIAVVLVMAVHLRSSVLISSMMPLAVLLCFLGMKFFGVDANIVALSGIAIAIGTIVDMGIVICENILRHLDEAPPDVPRLEVVHRAASEVGSAVITAVATTVVGFLPVFFMTGSEGKLFKPLAYTKTFALIASIVIALTVLPPAAHILFCGRVSGKAMRRAMYALVGAAGAALAVWGVARPSLLIAASGLAVVLFGLHGFLRDLIPAKAEKAMPWAASAIVIALVGLLLARSWEPLGPQRGLIRNLLFVGVAVGGLLALFELIRRWYPQILGWCLRHKPSFLAIPALLVLVAVWVWAGFDRIMGFIPWAAGRAGVDPQTIRSAAFWLACAERFPGLGREFMPPLDEGSYLFMPSLMAHASIGEGLDVLAKQDMAFDAIPEVESAVGKIGRAETPLDPAHLQMIETVVSYRPQYLTDKDGRRLAFQFEPEGTEEFKDEAGRAVPAPDGLPYTVRGRFPRDGLGRLIPDPGGQPFRLWRPALDPALNPGRQDWAGINSPEDIWQEVLQAARMPGVTSAPRLQPIAARIVMLQSGMRAPMGIKIKGPSLEAIEQVGLQIERLLREVPGVEASAVVADRIVAKPYLQIVPDRAALARYGVPIGQFQDVVESAVGGMTLTTTVEGRQRFGVRIRYKRELRDDVEKLRRILVAGHGAMQVPLAQLAEIRFAAGPQMIKSEDTFLVGYVTFDKKPGYAEVDVVEACQRHLKAKLDAGELVLPPGVDYRFAGSYEDQARAARTLALVLPLALFIIFMLIYFQFRSVITTGLVFSGVFVAGAGGFLMIWLYGQEWFLNFPIFGVPMRELFHVHTINMSVAVWVGFLALFGIATDDGVIMATYQGQMFRQLQPRTVEDVRRTVILAGQRRIRPCLMTTATTILALLPVLTATGRGSDIMAPMAIPSFGGMTIEVLTMFIVPVLYCWREERRVRAAS